MTHLLARMANRNCLSVIECTAPQMHGQRTCAQSGHHFGLRQIPVQSVANATIRSFVLSDGLYPAGAVLNLMFWSKCECTTSLLSAAAAPVSPQPSTPRERI